MLWLLSGVGLTGIELTEVVALLAVVSVGSGVLWFEVSYRRGQRSAWHDLGDDPALEVVDAAADGPQSERFAVYEITVDGRTPQAHVETHKSRLRDWVAWTVVELPLQAFERGEGFVVEGDYRPEGDVPAEIRDRVVEATDSRDQLTVDGGTGVVRFETKGLVTDPDEIRATAETVVAVARAVEREAGSETRSDEETETTTEKFA